MWRRRDSLALQGLPGIYVHSLVGSPNDHAGLRQTGRARTINREKWERADFERRLADPARHERRVFDRMAALIRLRRQQRALHPNAAQRILDLGNSAIFAVQRSAADSSALLCIHNVSAQPQALHFSAASGAYTDLIGGQKLHIGRSNQYCAVSSAVAGTASLIID